MKNILKKGAKYIISFVLMILVFTLLLTATNLIPREKIIEHIQESSEHIEELWHVETTTNFFHRMFFTVDAHTNSVMLNTALFVNNHEPLKTALEAPSLQTGINALTYAANNPYSEPDRTYSRYWHGYLVFLRPLLVAFNYFQISIINYFVFFVLFAICILMVSKRLGYWPAIVVTLIIVSLNVLVVPLSLQLNTVFLLTFVSIIAALIIYERKPEHLGLLFFIMGGITMYFDFYTYPILTYGFPMIILILINNQEKSIWHKAIWLKVLHFFSLWIIGYLLTWAIKVGMVALLVGEQEINKTFASVIDRTQRLVPETSLIKAKWKFDEFIPWVPFDKLPLWLIALGLPFLVILNKVTFIIAAVFGILFFALIIPFRRKGVFLKTVLPLLVVAIIPLIWFVVAANPTIIHFAFQYRGLGVTIFAVVAAMYAAIDYKKIKSKVWKDANRKLTSNQLEK